jgi:hypothetical protein
MSRKRKLTDRLSWPEDILAVELLDWETQPEDFNRLCRFIIESFAERDHLTRERLFSIVPEEEFRQQVRICAAASAEREGTDRPWSLVAYVYLRMKLLVLPRAARHKKGNQQ